MKTIIRNFLCTIYRFRIATILNVAGLSVAFTAFLILMMQVTYELGYDRFHRNADRIYRLEITREKEGASSVLNRPLYNAFKSSSAHIQAVTLLDPFQNQKQYISIEHNGERETFEELSFMVSSSFPNVFQLHMVEGKATALETPDQVLIPESMAHKFFGQEQAVGKRLESESWSATVGGVYRDWPGNTILGNAIYRQLSDKVGEGNWSQNNFECYVLLSKENSAENVLDNFKSVFSHESLDWKSTGLRLVPIKDVYFENDMSFDMRAEKGNKVQLLILSGIALLILIIAAINFTNFSNALIPMRLRSVNTQKVLGSPVSILRLSMIVEAVAICIMSYVMAIGMVYVLKDTSLSTMITGGISLETHYPLLVTTVCIAVIMGVLAGCWPAYYITSFPLAMVLNGNLGLSPKGQSLRNVLVGIQYVASFILIMGALFIYSQNKFMLHAPLGFDKEQILVANLNVKLQNKPQLIRQALIEIPDVEDVSLTSTIIGGSNKFTSIGREYQGEEIMYSVVKSDSYILNVLGIQPTEGRNFLPQDEMNSVVVFNETARKLYQMEVGKVVGMYWDGGSYEDEIIGFIPNIHYNSCYTGLEPFAIYVGPLTPNGPCTTAMIRTRSHANISHLLADIGNALKKIDPDYLPQVRFFSEIQENLYQKDIKLGKQVSFFSLVALFISLVGVFGVVMFESEYKKKEIGIRKVFGATTQQILYMFNKTYIRIVVICFILAAPVAWYTIQRWQEEFAYKISLSWWIYMLAFLIVTTLTLITVSIQNWRVANENPVNSIKSE